MSTENINATTVEDVPEGIIPKKWEARKRKGKTFKRKILRSNRPVMGEIRKCR